MKCKTKLQLVSVIFHQIFIFLPNDSPSKTVNNVFYFILYLILKRNSCMEWLFWVVDQNKKGVWGLAFGAHLLYDFSIKNVLYLILYQ